MISPVVPGGRRACRVYRLRCRTIWRRARRSGRIVGQTDGRASWPADGLPRAMQTCRRVLSGERSLERAFAVEAPLKLRHGAIMARLDLQLKLCVFVKHSATRHDGRWETLGCRRAALHCCGPLRCAARSAMIDCLAAQASIL